MHPSRFLAMLITGVCFSTPAISRELSQIAITLESESGGGINYLAFKVPSRDQGKLVTKNGKTIVSTIEHIYFIKKIEAGRVLINVSLKLFKSDLKNPELWTRNIEVSKNRKAEFMPFDDIKLILAFDN